jgi:hypothetical protein
LVFIRDKKVKGHSYAYLVRNVWDNKNGRVRQDIVKYLGRSSKVALEDIPKRVSKGLKRSYLYCLSFFGCRKNGIYHERENAGTPHKK